MLLGETLALALKDHVRDLDRVGDADAVRDGVRERLSGVRVRVFVRVFDGVAVAACTGSSAMHHRRTSVSRITRRNVILRQGPGWTGWTLDHQESRQGLIP
jgi:hypothetical protein